MSEEERASELAAAASMSALSSSVTTIQLSSAVERDDSDGSGDADDGGADSVVSARVSTSSTRSRLFAEAELGFTSSK